MPPSGVDATVPASGTGHVASLARLLAAPGAESFVGVGRPEGRHPAFLARMDDACFIRPYAGEGVALDSPTTADGELVVHHAPALADGRQLHELTAAEVAAARLKDGSGIPTLAEAPAVLSPIQVFIGAKGLHVRVQPSARAEVVLSQGLTLPLRQ